MILRTEMKIQVCNSAFQFLPVVIVDLLGNDATKATLNALLSPFSTPKKALDSKNDNSSTPSLHNRNTPSLQSKTTLSSAKQALANSAWYEFLLVRTSSIDLTYQDPEQIA